MAKSQDYLERVKGSDRKLGLCKNRLHAPREPVNLRVPVAFTVNYSSFPSYACYGTHIQLISYWIQDNH